MRQGFSERATRNPELATLPPIIFARSLNLELHRTGLEIGFFAVKPSEKDSAPLTVFEHEAVLQLAFNAFQGNDARLRVQADLRVIRVKGQVP